MKDVKGKERKRNNSPRGIIKITNDVRKPRRAEAENSLMLKERDTLPG